MAPDISPGKTWEGFAGGLVAAAGASIGLTALLGLPCSVPCQIAFGLLLGTVAPLGDLAESWMKRRAGVKDSGVIVPGHGGILDRMDSLLVTLPVTFYVAAYIIA